MTRRHKRKKFIQLLISVAVVYSIVLSVVLLVSNVKSVEVSGNNEIEDETNSVMYESEKINHNITSSSANASDNIEIVFKAPAQVSIETEVEMPIEEEVEVEIVKFSRNISEEDKYLLAKIAMAEAEGESLDTKIYIILSILNRVESEAKYFPDTIKEVIFQKNKGVYQFSPVMPGGRWWKVEPNDECWKAVEMVNEMEEDISNGALYFEACKGDSWHSRNLEFLFKSDHTRFYK